VIRPFAPSYVLSVALTLGVISAGPTRLTAQAAVPAAPAVVPATADNAAAFLGDWTLSSTGSNGTTTAALLIKVEAGKVTADMTSEATGRIAITDIKKAGLALILSYGFDYQGMAVPVVLTLTPVADKVTADFDYANGAYQASGTAVKKTPAPPAE
jgi:hypothetical protein